MAPNWPFSWKSVVSQATGTIVASFRVDAHAPPLETWRVPAGRRTARAELNPLNTLAEAWTGELPCHRQGHGTHTREISDVVNSWCRF